MPAGSRKPEGEPSGPSGPESGLVRLVHVDQDQVHSSVPGPPGTGDPFRQNRPREFGPPSPALLTHCAACGRKFGRKSRWTVAGWFCAGTPDDGDIVHWGCRFTHTPFAQRRKRKPAGNVPDNGGAGVAAAALVHPGPELVRDVMGNFGDQPQGAAIGTAK
jgi:hypothetical protein